MALLTTTSSTCRPWLGLLAALLALPLTLYGLLYGRWHATQPEPSRDVLAEISAAAAAVPEQERAWPVLREVWASVGTESPSVPSRDDDGEWVLWGHRGTPTPVDPATWLAEHPQLVETGRRVAGSEGFGWLSTTRPPDGSPEDAAGELLRGSVLRLRSPTLGGLDRHARIFAVDAELAARAGEGDRWLADLAAMKRFAGFAAEVRTKIHGRIAESLCELHDGAVVASLRGGPTGLGAEALEEAARRLATPIPAHTLRLEAERAELADLLQRVYGPGERGRLDATGVAVLQRPGGKSEPPEPGWRGRLDRLLEPLRLLRAVDREADRAAAARYLDAAEARLSGPLRDQPAASPSAVAGFRDPGFLQRHPVSQAMASADRRPALREEALGLRDAARLAVALERFRRSRGGGPDGLAALEPECLDRRPVDRITGEPLRYAVRGGEPVVWSLGADRDDDGGVPSTSGPSAVARWGEGAASPPDGDWILLGPGG